jgi:phospholipid/cholesterol/gamma-HCH transport system substrate-binding protein
MKISNETKVGALTSIAIVSLILGFNFLKGKTILKTGNYLHARYSDTKGIMISNAVYVNGFQVGSVADIENEDQTLRNIVISIKFKGNYEIPSNSIAVINSNPLGSSSLEIRLGNEKTFLKSGDTITTAASSSMLGGIMDKLTPVTDQLKITIHTLDSVMKNINTIFDPSTKNNLQSVILNVNKTTASLVTSSASLQDMLNKQTGTIIQSMNNLNSFTKNLSDNNDKINKTLENVNKASDNFSKADINGSVEKLKSAIDNLNKIMVKINSTDGSMGKLMNDPNLYNNLNNTIKSANILVDDLRLHPKRYVSLSVFGKKDKTGPLMAPLSDTVKPINK